MRNDEVLCNLCGQPSKDPKFKNLTSLEKTQLYCFGWLCDYCLSFQDETRKKLQITLLERLKEGYYKRDHRGSNNRV